MMSEIDNLNRNILEQVQSGNMKRDLAVKILKHINISQDIAVIGMACKYPEADNPAELWDIIRYKKSTIKKFPQKRIETLKSALGNHMSDMSNSNVHMGYLDSIDKFDAPFFKISSAEALKMEPSQRLFLQTAWEAVEDAGYGGNKIYGTRTGVYAGIDSTNKSQYMQLLKKNDLLKLTGSITGILSSRISYILNLHGPSIVVDTVCSGGLVAVHQACMALKNDECNMAIAGGINLFTFFQDSPGNTEIESDSGVIRPFDRDAEGTVWGEGVGVLFLKPLNKAIIDRDSIYAVIKGSAVNNDGMSNGITAPNPEAQTDVIKRAWKAAGINPETISYIETHGTGTKIGDPIEIEGLTNAFKAYTDKKQFCGIGSVKSNLGHTVAASGIASLIKVLMAMKKKVIPPTLNFGNPNPFIDFCNSPIYINDEVKNWKTSNSHPRRAGVSAFGFSGTNCHIVLEETSAPPIRNTDTVYPLVLTLSAKNRKLLQETLRRYIQFLNVNKQISMEDICYTANTGRGQYNCRMAIILHKNEILRDKLMYVEEAGIGSYFERDIIYGEHVVIPDFRKKSAGEQIFEQEKKRLTLKAQEIIKNILETNQNNTNQLRDLCAAYVGGAEIKWQDYYKNKELWHINIPVYPFDCISYWPKDITALSQDDKTAFYHTYWTNNETKGKERTEKGVVLILKDKTGVCNHLTEQIRNRNFEVIEVELGSSYSKISDYCYRIQNTVKDYKRLFEDCFKKRISFIIHSLTLGRKREAESLEELNIMQEAGVFSLQYLVCALIESEIQKSTELIVVSEYSCEVTKEEEIIIPHNELLSCLTKTMAQEYSFLKCRYIDVDLNTDIECILSEIMLERVDIRVAFRSGRRYIEIFEEYQDEKMQKNDIVIENKGVYIITGGTSGLGAETAKYLFKKNKDVKLAFINRTPMPARDEWEDNLIKSKDNKIKNRIETMKGMERDGLEFEFICGDVADFQQMNHVVCMLRNKYGKINGIVHSAGIGEINSSFNDKNSKRDEIFLPKVQGTWILDRVTAEDNLDFFILFSSVASVFGFPGQAFYAAANSYMNSYAQYRMKRGKKTLSISWSAWKDTGMAFESDMNMDGVFNAIQTQEGITALERVFQIDLSNIVIGQLNYKNSIFIGNYPFPFRLSEELIKKMNHLKRKTESTEEEKSEVAVKGKENNNYSVTEEKLAKIWAKILDLNEIDIYENFHDLGGNSILAGNLLKEIDLEFPGTMSILDIYSYPTVIQMAELITGHDIKLKRPEFKNVNVDDMEQSHDIAIIGMSCRFADAKNVDEFWKNLRSGKNCLRLFPKERSKDLEKYIPDLQIVRNSAYQVGYLDEIDKFDAPFFRISPKEAKLMDPMQKIFMEIAYESIEEAGYGGGKLYNTKTGVYLGVDFTNKSQYSDLTGEHGESLAAAGAVTGILASRIAYFLNLKGPCVVLDTACSSGLVALHHACMSIWNNESSMAIAGGINIFLFPQISAGVKDIETVNSCVKAFDKYADGTAWGEGAGAVLLKPLQHALRDRDNILAIIKGSAVNNDGASNGITAPNPDQQAEVITEAWRKGNINPETISYIECHGTGTVLGDPIEIKGLIDSFHRFTDRNQFCGIGSVKTNIGHLAAASGIASLIKVILSLQHRELPASLNFMEANPHINFNSSPVYVNDTLKKWNCIAPRRAGISSFGFSGTNCHLVVEEAPDTNKKQQRFLKGAEVLAVSAKTKTALKELILRYIKFLSNIENSDLSDICFTANTGRGHYNCRGAIIATDKEEFIVKLKRLAIYVEGEQDNIIEDGIFFGSNNSVSISADMKNVRKVSDFDWNEWSQYKYENSKKELLEQLCLCYVKDSNINWEKLYENEERNRTRVPVYPLERKRYWLDNQINIIRPRGEEKYLYCNFDWKEKAGTKSKRLFDTTLVIIHDMNGVGEEIALLMKEKVNRMIHIYRGTDYREIDDNNYSVSGKEEDYVAVLKKINVTNQIQILNLQSMNKGEDTKNIFQLETALEKGVLDLFILTKAIIHSEIKVAVYIVLVSQYVHKVTGKEPVISPDGAALFGLGQVIAQENKGIICKCIDIDETEMAVNIVNELGNNYDQYKTAYRKNTRYSLEIKEISDSSDRVSTVKVKPNGVYLITGGTGGIGTEICRYLGSENKVNLIVISRSKFQLYDWMKESKDGIIEKKMKIFSELKKKGTEVVFYQADISEEESMKHIIDEVHKKYGAIDGIVHCAGIAGGGFLYKKTELVFKEVLAPKIKGAFILNNLTKDDDLDFFVLFSSLTSVMGGVGQGDYAAANAYLDAFPFYMEKQGRKAVAINWPAWEETGMALKNLESFIKTFKPISTNTGIKVFEHALNSNASNMVVVGVNSTDFGISIEFPFDISDSVKKFLDRKTAQSQNNTSKNVESDFSLFETKIYSSRNKNRMITELERKIGIAWGKILELEEIDIEDNFFELGGNSLLSIKLESEMEKSNIHIRYSDIDRYPTINKLADYLNKTAGENNQERENKNEKQQKLESTNMISKESNHIFRPCIINNIEPINTFFYKNCFYHSLLLVLRHYNRPIEALLANDMITVEQSIENTIGFTVHFQAIKTFQDIIEDLGLSFEMRNLGNIENELMMLIENGCPVVIWIDCFYHSGRKDTYQKRHWPHTLVVYGFDKNLKKFHVIDHNHTGDRIYKHKEISFKDMTNCFEGYLRNYKSSSSANICFGIADSNFIKWKESEESIQKKIKKEFRNSLLNYKENLIESVQNLRAFSRKYEQLVLNEQLINQNGEKLLDFLNDIINSRQTERFRLSVLLENQEKILKLLDEIIECWEMVRAVIARYIYSSNYKRQSLEDSCKSVSLVCDKEESFVKDIMSKVLI